MEKIGEMIMLLLPGSKRLVIRTKDGPIPYWDWLEAERARIAAAPSRVAEVRAMPPAPLQKEIRRALYVNRVA